MNHQIPEDEKWLALLAGASSTFAGEASPPYGFATRALARLKAEKRDGELMERIGLRSLCFALVLLGVVGVSSLLWENHVRTDFDPGVRNLILADKIPIS